MPSSTHHERRDLPGGRLFLIDGMSLIYRAFHAIRGLSTSKGQPTNAIYGVAISLAKLLKEEKPDYCAFALDRPEPTFRHQRYAQYKEHRPPMPEELVSQLPWIKELVRAFQIPIVEEPGYEADDILGTLTRRAKERGLEVALVTSDKDALQLVNPHVWVHRPTGAGYERIDEEEFKKRWSIEPRQMVDVMALMGDPTDAVPGVPGIGQKRAVELIQQFGSLNALLERPEEISSQARREAIVQHREQVERNLELVTLDTEVPLAIDLGQLKAAEPDERALRQLYQRFEFRALLAELKAEEPATRTPVKRIESEEEIPALLAGIREAGKAALVCLREGLGISFREGSAIALPSPLAQRILALLWGDSGILKICPDLKEHLVILSRLGFEGKGPWADPSLASYLLDPARPSHSIEALAQEFLDESIAHGDPLSAAALQAEAALRLIPILEREIRQKDLWELFSEVETPLSLVLAGMERHGIAVDEAELAQLSRMMRDTLEGLTREIYRLSGREFNINSPKQLGQILFEELRMPIVKRTKTGASTDLEVLRSLSAQHELPAKLLEYREMFKLNSTYCSALPKLIDPATHRIHASFNQKVTATGRLSASAPNLQNIPIRTELGRQIRRAFIPSQPGWLFLSADYSQIELRILAHLSQDEALLEAFAHHQDIHRMMAAEIFHGEPAQVSQEERSAAKTINFGILYGMTPFGLAKELKISPQEAQEFIDRYFGRFPQVQEYLRRSVEEARERGYTTTLFHRRRYLPELNASDVVVRQFAERTAVNTPIQGSAADLIKVAMVSVDQAIREKGLLSRMLLQVHDELVFEAPREELPRLRALVEEKMTTPTLKGRILSFSVPIEIKLKEGRNWLEASHAPGGVSGGASDSPSHAPGGVSGGASDSPSHV